MKKFLLIIGILVIGGGIAALEYTLFPYRAVPLKNTDSGNGSSEDNMPLSHVSEKNFEIVGMDNITRSGSRIVSHLFGSLDIIKDRDEMVVLRSDFYEEEKPNTILVSIYEIFPLRDTTASKAFSYLESAFEEKFANNVETGINRTDEFGVYSFYFNSSLYPKKAFLLGVTTDRLIGLEYLKENHEKLKPVIEHLLPSV